MLVTPTGGKLWRFRWRDTTGNERTLSLGSYPDVSLEQAEAKRDATRKDVAAEVDPVAKRRAENLATVTHET